MICPTLVLTLPAHVDFPLFRYRLEQWQHYFQDVFIAFANTNQPEVYVDWFKEHYPKVVTFVPVHLEGTDWRDNAVSSILDVAQWNKQTTHYLFIEPDILIKDDSFWGTVLKHDQNFIYYMEGDRIHPAFALVKKELVQKTSQDFAAYPDVGLDHFGKFFTEVSAMTSGVDLRVLGLKEREDYYHMAGNTQNFSCYKNNEPFYKPDEFLAYNYLCNNLDIPMPEGFRKLAKNIEVEKGRGDTEGVIKNFFPL